MKRSYIFSKKALKQLADIDKVAQKQIIKKMDEFCLFSNPLIYAKRLVNFPEWSYRFRIGDYRVICDADEEWKLIIIALIWHRRDIYE